MKPKLKYFLTSFMLLANSVFSQDISDPFTKVVEIGPWDMDENQVISVKHGIDLNKYTIITPVEVSIMADTDDVVYFFNSGKTYYDVEWKGYRPVPEVDNINVKLIDNTIAVFFSKSGFFDNYNFDRTDKNRGYLTIKYTKK